MRKVGTGPVGREPKKKGVDGEKLLARLDGAEITVRRSAECASALPLVSARITQTLNRVEIDVTLTQTHRDRIHGILLHFERAYRVCYNFDNKRCKR